MRIHDVCFFVCIGWFTYDRVWCVCVRFMDIKWWGGITAGYNFQKVDTMSYCVTAHLTFPDPKHENRGNYHGNSGNFPVIRNQACQVLNSDLTYDQYLGGLKDLHSDTPNLDRIQQLTNESIHADINTINSQVTASSLSALVNIPQQGIEPTTL